MRRFSVVPKLVSNGDFSCIRISRSSIDSIFIRLQNVTSLLSGKFKPYRGTSRGNLRGELLANLRLNGLRLRGIFRANLPDRARDRDAHAPARRLVTLSLQNILNVR